MFTHSKPDIITAVQGLSIHYPGYIIILFLDAVYLSQNSIFLGDRFRVVDPIWTKLLMMQISAPNNSPKPVAVELGWSLWSILLPLASDFSKISM